MKLQFINSQYNNNMLKDKRQVLLQSKFKEHKSEYSSENTDKTGPAQAISFGGSAVSLAQKLGNAFLESGKINKLIYFVNENEAAFNAIYALIVAGMLKPGLVLAQTGFTDKDGQMIATKNSLQAFVGFFLGMTVGGGFIKKIWDSMSNNINLLKKVQENGKTILKTKSPFSEDAQEIAKKLLVKENSGLKAKIANAQQFASKEKGILKFGAFIDGFSNFSYKPDKKAIDTKAKELIWNLREKHLPIFNKNDNTRHFTIKLVENLEKLKINPSSAKRELAKGLKSQPWDAFESFWKNCTNIFTVVAKAKISSILLPIAVAAIFAKRNAEAEAKNTDKKQHNEDKLPVLKTDGKYKNFQKVTSSDIVAQPPSFKGSISDNLINGSTKFFEKLALSDTGQGIVDAISKNSAKPSHLMSHVESIGITLYWLLNTHFSKKIDPDQKLGLNVHTALVTVLSSLASLVIDGVSDGLIAKAEKSYLKRLESAVSIAKNNVKSGCTEDIVKDVVNQCSKLYNTQEIAKKLSQDGVLNNPKELEKTIQGIACRYSKHLSKFKSLMIFTLVVRFLVPVLTVKQSKKIKKFLIEYSKKRAEKKQARAV